MERTDSEREEPVHAQNEETVATLHSLQLSPREYLRPEYGPPFRAAFILAIIVWFTLALSIGLQHVA
jgi:hypothetical protein